MHKRRYFLILISLLLLLLCGCQENGQDTTHASIQNTTLPVETEAPLPELEFTLSAKSFGEKYGNYYDKKRSQTTDFNGVTYHFDVEVAVEDRVAVVMEADWLISALLADFPEFERNLTVAVRDDDYPMRVAGHTLYIGIEHFKTQRFALGMAWALFGHHVNYGLIYGHGTRIAQEMGYETELLTVTAEDALTLYDDAPEYLDLNYACFLERFADEETLNKVKTLAVSFYNYLRDNDGLSLLTDYSDESYCALLSEYLTAHGKGEYSNADLGGTFFYYGGPMVALIWETADGIFYLQDAYAAQYMGKEENDRLNSGYPNLRRMIIDYAAQADFMEAKLGQYESDASAKVDVLFQEEHATDRYSMANYTKAENLIRMFSAEPFLHEYGHYLLRETGIPSWLNEVICYYYGYAPIEGNPSYMWEAEVDRMQSLSPTNPNTMGEQQFLDLLCRNLDHTIDFANPEDFEYLFSGLVVVTDTFSLLTNPDAGAEAKLSFLHYLIGLVGEEAAIDAIATNAPEAVFGKAWEQLMIDWEAAIRAEYAWLKQYYNIEWSE